MARVSEAYMKPIASIIVLAIAIGFLIPAHYVEDHETISQVIWNRQEAVVFAGVRREGWAGSYARLGFEFVRGIFGKIPGYQSSKQWVLVARISAGGIETHIEDNTPFFMPQPFEEAIFRDGKPLLKLTGTSFTPASLDETQRFAERTRAYEPNYDNTDGWSSRMNLLNQGSLRVEVPMKLADTEIVLIAERTQDRSQKKISVRFPGKTTEVLSVSEVPKFVGSTEYENLIAK
jgi:hypothetical protein